MLRWLGRRFPGVVVHVQERFIVPGLGVVVLAAILTMEAPWILRVLLGVLGLAAVGTYFLPHAVQVETRIVIAVLGLTILIFISSLGLWLTVLAFATVGALQARHRDTLQSPPHTVSWLRTVLGRPGTAGAAATQADATQADDGDGAPLVAAPLGKSSVRSPTQVPHLIAGIASIVVVIAAFLPWATLFGLSVSGINADATGDGIITLILGVVALSGIVVSAYGRRWAAILAAILGAAVTAVGIYDWVEIRDATSLSVGVGVYLTTFAGIVLVLAGAWAYVSARKSA